MIIPKGTFLEFSEIIDMSDRNHYVVPRNNAVVKIDSTEVIIPTSYYRPLSKLESNYNKAVIILTQNIFADPLADTRKTIPLPIGAKFVVEGMLREDNIWNVIITVNNTKYKISENNYFIVNKFEYDKQVFRSTIDPRVIIARCLKRRIDK